MNDQFLYEELDTLLKHGAIKKEIPSFLIDNLNAKLKLRPYQEEAFARFFYCFEKGLSAGNKQKSHFLFNMATGSGKTIL